MKYRLLFILFVALVGFRCVAAEGSPEQQVVALVKQLEGNQRATAFQHLFAGTLAQARKPTEVRMMDPQAEAVWDLLGPPLSYEIIERQAVGQKLFRIKWITWQKDDVPLFWNGLFLKRHGKWEVFGLLFFDDPLKAGM